MGSLRPRPRRRKRPAPPFVAGSARWTHCFTGTCTHPSACSQRLRVEVASRRFHGRLALQPSHPRPTHRRCRRILRLRRPRDSCRSEGSRNGTAPLSFPPPRRRLRPRRPRRRGCLWPGPPFCSSLCDRRGTWRACWHPAARDRVSLPPRLRGGASVENHPSRSILTSSRGHGEYFARLTRWNWTQRHRR